MLDSIGSLRVRAQSKERVLLTLARSTQVSGAVLLLVGGYLVVLAWPVSPYLAGLPAMIALIGLLLGSLRRTLEFDRADGVLRIEQRVFGIASRSVVPLFHLRAVVIAARSAEDSLLGPPRFVAYVDKRVGGAIPLDESRRCAILLRMGEAIAEVAELRLEYDATATRATAD
jgi:hypothetical protein